MRSYRKPIKHLFKKFLRKLIGKENLDISMHFFARYHQNIPEEPVCGFTVVHHCIREHIFMTPGCMRLLLSGSVIQSSSCGLKSHPVVCVCVCMNVLLTSLRLQLRACGRLGASRRAQSRHQQLQQQRSLHLSAQHQSWWVYSKTSKTR